MRHNLEDARSTSPRARWRMFLYLELGCLIYIALPCIIVAALYLLTMSTFKLLQLMPDTWWDIIRVTLGVAIFFPAAFGIIGIPIWMVGAYVIDRIYSDENGAPSGDSKRNG